MGERWEGQNDVIGQLQQAAVCIAHWLFYFNSAVNPIIYNFMSSEYSENSSHIGVVFYRPGNAAALPMLSWDLPIPLWTLPLTDATVRTCIWRFSTVKRYRSVFLRNRRYEA